jgi:hypothetical protein
VWTYKFNVTVQPDGSFTGTDTVTPSGAYGGEAPMTEHVTGQFGGTPTNPTVSFTATRDSSTLVWSETNAVMDGTTTNLAYSTPDAGYPLWQRITPPVITQAITTDLNHGQYVSSQGGGADNAHSLVGMPVNSSK